MTIYVDDHEPAQAVTLLGQSLTVKVTGLNRNGWADYMFAVHDGVEHVERKQVGEILSDMDGVEDQLRRELISRPENRLWLLIEGVATFSQDQITHNVEQGGKLYPTRTFRTRPEKWDSWIVALQRLGVTVLRSNDIGGTCRVLTALIKGGQSPHTTLNRPLQPKIYYHQNTQVRALMGVPGGGVGPVLAERLIDEFGSVYGVVTKRPGVIASKVQGVSIARATKLLRALGRKV